MLLKPVRQALISVSVTIFTVVVVQTLLFTPMKPADRREAVYDRVMRTNELRCGYISYAPWIIKDPNTGKLSGFMYDIVNRAGANLGLKVVWNEEVTYATMVEGLETGRYDVMCGGIWVNAPRARGGDFSVALAYSVIDAYTGANSKLQAGADLNQPAVRIAGIDGEMSDQLAHQQFSKAAELSLPNTADFSQLLLSVADGKADVVFAEKSQVQMFLKHNPGRLRSITPDRHIGYYATKLLLPRGDVRLKAMLDAALDEIIGQGFVQTTLAAYAAPDILYPPARPF